MQLIVGFGKSVSHAGYFKLLPVVCQRNLRRSGNSTPSQCDKCHRTWTSHDRSFRKAAGSTGKSNNPEQNRVIIQRQRNVIGFPSIFCRIFKSGRIADSHEDAGVLNMVVQRTTIFRTPKMSSRLSKGAPKASRRGGETFKNHQESDILQRKIIRISAIFLLRILTWRLSDPK